MPHKKTMMMNERLCHAPYGAFPAWEGDASTHSSFSFFFFFSFFDRSE
nr:hypothetical protein [Caballeronia fortuita]